MKDRTIMANDETVEVIFDEFSEQGWSLEFKWQLLSNFLDAYPNPADRTNEKLRAFLQYQFDEECGFNDENEPDEFDQKP
jgi:hypothetical protein